MYKTLIKDIFVVFLTVAGLFTTSYPLYLLIAGAGCMVFLTFQSFFEKESKGILLVEVILLLVFAALTGSFAGFLIFYLVKKCKGVLKGMLGILAYGTAEIAVFQSKEVPMIIFYGLLLATGFAVLFLFEYLITSYEGSKKYERERTIATNISEMHEKRLNEELSIQKAIDERNARLMERENISRNIHNSVGHSITAAIMTLDAADMLYEVKPEEARKKMNDANERMRGSLESIRRAVRVLDEDNQTLTASDLKSELQMIVKEFVMDTTLKVYENYKELRDDVNIPHDHVVFLTGVLQELLTNGVKHGKASKFVVTLIGDSKHLKMVVSDDGTSDFCMENQMQRIENGFGLKKIISYVEKNGGKTSFDNENGFRGMIEIPILT